MKTTKKDVIEYIAKKYKIKPDYPFSKFRNYAVFRHTNNRKWFALIMNVPYEKIGLSREGNLNIIDLKIDSEISCIINLSDGIIPAYHMNKEHWVSVLLNKSVAQKKGFNLINDSFNLTK